MTRLILILAVALPLSAATTVKVRTGNATQELPLERYVAAVLAGESSIFRSDAALQAMSVAARTYAISERGRHAAEGYDFCSTTHCQRLDFAAITPRLESIAADTAGELLWFQGKPTFTPYTRDCGGRSESGDQPYLNSHPDEYCVRAGIQTWQYDADPAKIAQALRDSTLPAPRAIAPIAIVERTASGRAQTLLLGGSTRISAGSFRLAVGRALGWNTLHSDLYEIQSNGPHILFQGRGSGHGMGLCQRGADEMGREGRSYREILAYYYPGTSIGLTARGLAWQRLSGDGLALWTTEPARDSEVLSIASREARAAARRTNWPLPQNIEIRIYPDLDSYRNATGEPGTTAAFTAGRRIHMQPAAILRSRDILDSTLRHELYHVLVESQAAHGLPLWFREEVVRFLAGQPNTVARYGETALLGWVTRGLPPDVTNSRASQPATKSR